MVPTAIFTNATRVTIAGILAHRFGPETSEGFVHAFSGWLIFLSAVLLLLLFHWLLRRFRESPKDVAHA